MEDKKEELLEGARGLNTHTSIKHLSNRLPQNPFSAISKGAPSWVLEVAKEKLSGLETSCNSGSTHTWEQTLAYKEKGNKEEATHISRQVHPERLIYEGQNHAHLETEQKVN